MDATEICLHRDGSRARVDLRAGAVIPRLISRTASSARIALVAGGALLLGGDRVKIDIHVGAGCRLELDDVGGTVAYDADGELSSWTVRINVDAGGMLLWRGQPFIVADGAHVDRGIDIQLADEAIVCIRETIVLGRSGERGGRLRARSRASADGRPIFVEDLTADGAQPEPGVLGAHRIMDSILLFGARLPDGPRTFQLEEHGSITRLLGVAMHRATLDDAWAQVESALHDSMTDLEPRARHNSTTERKTSHART